MRELSEIKDILKNARECGCPTVVIDGVKYELASPESIEASKAVPDMAPEDIVKPLSVLDELSNEEMLYWATPYYDELQAAKELRNQQLKDGVLTNGEK